MGKSIESKASESPGLYFVKLIVKSLAALISFYFTSSFWYSLCAWIFGWWYILYILITGKLANGELGKIIEFYFN